MDDLSRLASDPRVNVRRAGPPDPSGACVVYWMQRAQRGLDNPALDVAVNAANALDKPVVVFFAPVPFYPHANLRHYRFLAEGIPDIAAALHDRNIGFVLRRFPEHSLLKFCNEVKAALVVGDENPMREPEAWRRIAAKKLKVPLWTVDADVIVPSKLLERNSTPPTSFARDFRHNLRSSWCRRKIPPQKLHGQSRMACCRWIPHLILRRAGSSTRPSAPSPDFTAAPAKPLDCSKTSCGTVCRPTPPNATSPR